MRPKAFLTLACLVLCLGIALPRRVTADGPLYPIRQRFGVNVAPAFNHDPTWPGELSDFPASDQLGFGWYSDWWTRQNPQRPNGIEYAQLINTNQWPPNWKTLEATLRANPGALWIIGNEPETRGQGEHTPAVYAERYHDFYYGIKSIDPQAQVAIGGVVMPTPLRLKWLELAMAEYEARYSEPMPVDVWNIHMQILQEKRNDWGCGIPTGLTENAGRLYEIIDNCSVPIFQQLISEFCTWLVEHDQRGKPVIISEYGVLMPSSYLPQGYQSVIQFMRGTFDYMLNTQDPLLGYAADENRLVQRWMWFSLNFPLYDDTAGGFNGALYDWRHPDQLTVFGRTYRDYVGALIYTPTPTSTPAKLLLPLIASYYPLVPFTATPTATSTPTDTPTPEPTQTTTPTPSAAPTISELPTATTEPTVDELRPAEVSTTVLGQ